MRRAGSCTTLSFAVGEAALEHTESIDKTLNPQVHSARESWPRPENNSNTQGADTAGQCAQHPELSHPGA